MISREVYESNDAVGLAQLIASKQLSATELVEESIRRIEEKNPKVNAVVFKAYEHARRRAGGPLPEGPLSGVPFVIKDLSTQYEGFPVTNGSKLFKNAPTGPNSLFADRMAAAGLIAVGKSNLPELGLCPTTMRFTALPPTPGTRASYRAAPAAVRPSPLPPAWSRLPTPPTVAARSAFPLR